MEHRKQSALAYCSPLNFSIDLLVVLIVDSDRGHLHLFHHIHLVVMRDGELSMIFLSIPILARTTDSDCSLFTIKKTKTNVHRKSSKTMPGT